MRPLFKQLFYVLCLFKGETGGTWKEQGEAGAGASAAPSQAGTKARAGIGKRARSEMLAGEPGN